MKIFLSILVALVLCSIDMGIPIHYFPYLIVLFIFLLRLPGFSLSFSHPMVRALGIIVISSTPWILGFDIESIKDAGLMFIGILCFLSRKRFSINLKLINFIMMATTLYSLRSGTLSLTYENYLNSDIGYESAMLSFVYPFFVVYWAKKNRYLMGANLLFILLAGKRIGILAALVGVAYVYIMDRREMTMKQVTFFKYILIAVNFAYLIVTFLLMSDFFNGFVSEQFGMSINQFTMGRYELYNTAVDEAELFVGHNWLTGIGTGNILPLIIGQGLHNDLLRLLLENGIVVFSLFIYLVYDIRYFKQWSIIIVQNVLWMTDNTLIYIPVIFAACLFVSIMNAEEKAEQSASIKRREPLAFNKSMINSVK